MMSSPTQEAETTFDPQTSFPLLRSLSRLHPFLALLDPKGNLLWQSEALGRELRPAEPEVNGASEPGGGWLACLCDSEQRRRLAHLLETGGCVRDEAVRLHTAGAIERGARISAVPVRGADGRAATLLQVEMEEPDLPADRALRMSLGTLCAILDSAPEGVLAVDRQRTIRYANPALSELSGWPVEELLDQPLDRFLPSGETVDRMARALRPECPPRSRDLEVRRKDGSPIWVNASVTPLRLPSGEVAGTVAYVRDVTERRRFEQELAHKNAELEHYVRAVSHDLRSPLVAILGFSRLLREDYGQNLEEKGRHFLIRIEEAGRTMEALIQHLLQLSRLGKAQPVRSPVDPRKILLQLQAELKPRLDERGIRLEIPEDPPVMRCDRTQLYQVLSNLIGNALDHMGPCADPTVRVEIETVGGSHRVAVIDHGRGIAPGERERIFELFQRLEGPAHRGNLGIGLAVVRKIAEAHGGAAWVEGEPGEGARFYATFPHG